MWIAYIRISSIAVANPQNILVRVSEAALVISITRLQLLLSTICPSVLDSKVHREDAH